MSCTPNDYVDLELESCLRRISGYILGFKNLIAESVYPLASEKKEFRKIAELFEQNHGNFDDKAKNGLSDVLANKKARDLLEMSCSLYFQGVKLECRWCQKFPYLRNAASSPLKLRIWMDNFKEWSRKRPAQLQTSVGYLPDIPQLILKKDLTTPPAEQSRSLRFQSRMH